MNTQWDMLAFLACEIIAQLVRGLSKFTMSPSDVLTNWSELAAMQLQAIVALICLGRTVANVVLYTDGRTGVTWSPLGPNPFKRLRRRPTTTTTTSAATIRSRSFTSNMNDHDDDDHATNSYRHHMSTWQRTRIHAYMTAYAYLISWGALIIWQACLLPPLADLKMAHALLQIAVDVLGYGYIFVTLTQPNQHTMKSSVRYACPILAVIIIITSICYIVYDPAMSSGHKAMLLIETVLVCQVWNMSLALPYDPSTILLTSEHHGNEEHALLQLQHSSSSSGLADERADSRSSSIGSNHSNTGLISRGSTGSIGSDGSSGGNTGGSHSIPINNSSHGGIRVSLSSPMLSPSSISPPSPPVIDFTNVIVPHQGLPQYRHHAAIAAASAAMATSSSPVFAATIASPPAVTHATSSVSISSPSPSPSLSLSASSLSPPPMMIHREFVGKPTQ